MKGAVAAGHPLTAQAGARILAEGGNAVDACIAAGAVSWVTESPLTGPGGGGFMLVHRAGGGTAAGDTLLDFFVTIPGAGLAGEAAGTMAAVEVPFDPRTVQIFLVGGAACAVPGSVAGLAKAHRLYARLPWSELLAPAIELAREGIEITEQQAFLHTILDAVLRLTPEGRLIYGGDACLGAGATIRMRDLGETLELLATEGADAFYRGELAWRIADAVREEGGRITREDLEGYRVVRRRPVRARFRGHEFVSNPPPSSGGLLIAFALSVLDRLEADAAPGEAAWIATLAEVMRQATLVRGGSFTRDLYRGGLLRRVLGADAVEAAARAVRERPRAPVAEAAGSPSTTHISVVDADGNAASLSASTGCGSGVVVPGTGIHLNNMLGEEDLTPVDGAVRPGRRLTSMMSPSLVLRDGTPRLVVGSAGSVRLRAAILQIVLNVVEHGMTVGEAIDAPRVHLDGDVLHLEGGVDAAVADELAARGYALARWPERNLYFGGAAAVALGEGGTLDAAGDPRRGGAGVVVR